MSPNVRLAAGVIAGLAVGYAARHLNDDCGGLLKRCQGDRTRLADDREEAVFTCGNMAIAAGKDPKSCERLR
jgi:hypothetical protein